MATGFPGSPTDGQIFNSKRYNSTTKIWEDIQQTPASINRVPDGDFENTLGGWKLYTNNVAGISPTPLAWTSGVATSLTPSFTTGIDGTYSLNLARGGTSAQGQGLYRNIFIPSSNLSKTHQLQFNYITTTGILSGDIVPFIWDVTNGSFVNLSLTTIAPSLGSAFNYNVQFNASFIPNNNSNNYYVLFHFATTNINGNIYLDDVNVVTQSLVTDASVSPWFPYPAGTYSVTGVANPVTITSGKTPIMQVSSNPTKGTMPIDIAEYKQDGEDLLIHVKTYTSVSGSGGSGYVVIPLPLGLTAYDPIPGNTNVSAPVMGNSKGFGSYSTTNGYDISAELITNNALMFVYLTDTSGGSGGGWVGNITTSPWTFEFTVRMKCAQFVGKGTTTLASAGAPFYLSNNLVTPNTNGTTANTYNGIDGSVLIANTAQTYYDIQLPRALLPNEIPYIELRSKVSGSWIPLDQASSTSIRSYKDIGGVDGSNVAPSGISIRVSNNGQLRIYFGQYAGWSPTTWGGFVSWATALTDADGYDRWRVKIATSASGSEVLSNANYLMTPSPWMPYTPTISSTGVAPTLGTNTLKTAWRQNGNNMDLIFTLNQTVAGSPGSGVYLISLPTGYTIDTTNLILDNASTLTGSSVGQGSINGASIGKVTIHPYSSTQVLVGIIYTNGSVTSSGYWGPTFGMGALNLEFNASVPCAQFSSPFTYNNVNQPFYISNTFSTPNTNGGVGNTYLGSDGTPILSNTASTYYDIQLPRALTTDESPRIELRSKIDGNWVPIDYAGVDSLGILLGQNELLNGTSSQFNGIVLTKVSAGQLRVRFAPRAGSSIPTWSSGTYSDISWATMLSAVDGYDRWRVRIASSAVGATSNNSSGGGSSTPNSFISNSTLENGITGYNPLNNGAVSVPTGVVSGTLTSGTTLSPNTSNTLSGTGDLLFSKQNATSSQGNGFAYDFSIDRGSVGITQQISFLYQTSTNYAGDMSVFIWDVTNSVLLPMSVSQIQASGTLPTQFISTFIPPSNSVNFRLIFFVTTTSTATWTFEADNIVAYNKTTIIDSAISPWMPYPAGTYSVAGVTNPVTITSGKIPAMQVTSNPTKGTGTVNDIAEYKQDVDNLLVHLKFSCTVAGTNGSGIAIFPLPLGYTADTTSEPIIGSPASPNNGVCVGDGTTNNASTGILKASLVTNNAIAVSYWNTVNNGIFSAQSYVDSVGTFELWVKVKCAQFAGKGTVNLASSGTPFYLSNASNAIADANGNNTYNGVEGTPIINASASYSLKLPRLLLPNEVPNLEVRDKNTGSWIPVGQAVIFDGGGLVHSLSPSGSTYSGASTGMGLRNSGITNCLGVYFANQASTDTSNGGYSWAGVIANYYDRWRVKISSSASNSEIPPTVISSVRGSVAITAGVVVKLPTVVSDAYSLYNPSTGLFTIKMAGWYDAMLVSASVNNSPLEFYVQVNGADPDGVRAYYSQQTSSSVQITGAIPVYCKVGDTISFLADGGGTTTAGTRFIVKRTGS